MRRSAISHQPSVKCRFLAAIGMTVLFGTLTLRLRTNLSSSRREAADDHTWRD